MNKPHNGINTEEREREMNTQSISIVTADDPTTVRHDYMYVQ